MAKYRIPRDTDVEGDLRVYSNTAIDGDLQVTGDIVTSGSITTESTTKSVALLPTIAGFVPIIEIFVNSDAQDVLQPQTGNFANAKADIHVPTGITKLIVNVDATPTGGNAEEGVFISNASIPTGSRETILEVEFVVTGNNTRDVDYEVLIPTGLGTEVDIIPNSDLRITITATEPLTSTFRIDRRNSTRFKEIIRTSGGSTIYRDNEDIDAALVPVDTITQLPGTNVQEVFESVTKHPSTTLLPSGEERRFHAQIFRNSSGEITVNDYVLARTFHTTSLNLTDNPLGTNVSIIIGQFDHIFIGHETDPTFDTLIRLAQGSVPISTLEPDGVTPRDPADIRADLIAIRDDTTGDYTRVNEDSAADEIRVQAGQIVVADDTDPETMASLELFYANATSGPVDVTIDISDIEDSIIHNNIELGKLAGHWVGEGLTQRAATRAVEVTFRPGNLIQIIVRDEDVSIVDGDFPGFMVGDFIGISDSIDTVDLNDTASIDAKLRITAISFSTDTTIVASIIRVYSNPTTAAFSIFSFNDGPVTQEFVFVNEDLELTNIRPGPGIRISNRELLIQGTADDLISIHTQSVDEYRGDDPSPTDYLAQIEENLDLDSSQDFYNILGLHLVFNVPGAVPQIGDIDVTIPSGTTYYLFPPGTSNFSDTDPSVVLRADDHRMTLPGDLVQVRFVVLRGLDTLIPNYPGGTHSIQESNFIHTAIWRYGKIDEGFPFTLQRDHSQNLVFTESPEAATTTSESSDNTLTTKNYVDDILTYADLVNGAGKIEDSGEVNGNQYIEYSHPTQFDGDGNQEKFFRVFLPGEEEIRIATSDGDVILTRVY